MKFLILPVRDVQVGDVVFTNDGADKGIQFCGRVFGFNDPSPLSDITELRILPLPEPKNGKNKSPSQVIGLKHDTRVGVARSDEFVDIDIAALLNE